MSGTGPTPAEQHLGDRLAALVDGELKHDVRDRVLAHLATCPKCKAEADAQRRLKSVFAQSAPPPVSEGLLARLQGLPGGPGGGDPGRGPFQGASAGRDTGPVFGGVTPSTGRPDDRHTETFGYVPGGHLGTGVLPLAPSGARHPGPRGFRIHDVGREADRSPWRGRRFAFAAASAVSFAAIALGGALPLEASLAAGPRGGNTGNKVTPLGPAASGNPGVSNGSTAASVRSTEYERRRGSGHAPTRSDGRAIGLSVSGPLSPGPLNQPLVTPAVGPITSVTTLGGLTPTPLIRPTGSVFQLATAHGVTPWVTPSPSHLRAPTHPPAR
ncbi:anti-sigma factor family protein [Streptomyces albipurpureus]|uniref:Zf-HC2 domain-containing protein n=1 Tax=Streptomyces albipurpureus TaxID=2897419 RepID=A0ABT0ULG8_9ACTN|nr:zf-HC2 domain-containing protein [Streptomyces sp. CWNU-1]MCM2389076.1 zf-HC2 domain-containing protein [Streptomyces sp. CWNU-1]